MIEGISHAIHSALRTKLRSICGDGFEQFAIVLERGSTGRRTYVLQLGEPDLGIDFDFHIRIPRATDSDLFSQDLFSQLVKTCQRGDSEIPLLLSEDALVDVGVRLEPDLKPIKHYKDDFKRIGYTIHVGDRCFKLGVEVRINDQPTYAELFEVQLVNLLDFSELRGWSRHYVDEQVRWGIRELKRRLILARLYKPLIAGAVVEQMVLQSGIVEGDPFRFSNVSLLRLLAERIDQVATDPSALNGTRPWAAAEVIRPWKIHEKVLERYKLSNVKEEHWVEIVSIARKVLVDLDGQCP